MKLFKRKNKEKKIKKNKDIVPNEEYIPQEEIKIKRVKGCKIL